jgi:hypothetical protein
MGLDYEQNFMTPLRNGLFTGLTFYGIAIATTLICYYLIQWDLMSGVSTVFMSFIFFFFIGIYRLFKTAIRVSRNRDIAKNKGEMLVHLSFFTLFVLFFFYVILSN